MTFLVIVTTPTYCTWLLIQCSCKFTRKKYLHFHSGVTPLDGITRGRAVHSTPPVTPLRGTKRAIDKREILKLRIVPYNPPNLVNSGLQVQTALITWLLFTHTLQVLHGEQSGLTVLRCRVILLIIMNGLKWHHRKKCCRDTAHEVMSHVCCNVVISKKTLIILDPYISALTP